jgi:hypothetical protein
MWKQIDFPVALLFEIDLFVERKGVLLISQSVFGFPLLSKNLPHPDETESKL